MSNNNQYSSLRNTPSNYNSGPRRQDRKLGPDRIGNREKNIPEYKDGQTKSVPTYKDNITSSYPDYKDPD